MARASVLGHSGCFAPNSFGGGRFYWCPQRGGLLERLLVARSAWRVATAADTPPPKRGFHPRRLKLFPDKEVIRMSP